MVPKIKLQIWFLRFKSSVAVNGLGPEDGLKDGSQNFPVKLPTSKLYNPHKNMDMDCDKMMLVIQKTEPSAVQPPCKHKKEEETQF